MTPQEKARDLFNQYAVMWHESTVDVKQCVLIAVSEILDVLGSEGVFTFADSDVAKYWEQVKAEIKKL